MSEIVALLALYGAIDRAVVADEADATELAPLLNAYQDGAAVGWYDGQYVPWVESVKERAWARARSGRKASLVSRSMAAAEASGPTADAPEPGPRALEVGEALSALPPVPPEGRMAARRLLAVTAAARALPQFFGPSGSRADVAAAALAFRTPGSDPDDFAGQQRSRQLHARFAEQFASMSDWQDVVTGAIADGLLPESFRSQAAAKPCTGKLIMRPDPSGKDPDPCAVLEAEFITGDVTFDDAKRYLVPSNWPLVPGSFWCRMDEDGSLGPNSWLYHETVATSCPASSAAWSVSTDLQFWFSHPTATEARVEYDLAPGLPTPSSDINVDEGSLRITKLHDDRVHVKTTKRVRFAGNFDGSGMTMFMCATGYTSMLEDLVFAVSEISASASTPFPVQPPQGGTVSPPQPAKKTAAKKSAARKTAAKKTAAKEAGGETFDDVASEAAAFVQSYIKDVTDTCAASLKSIEAGTYKVEDAWADGIAMWSTYLTGISKALDLGTRTLKAAAKESGET